MLRAVKYLVKYFEEGIVVGILCAMVLLICYNIFMRYLTGREASWIYEVASLFLIWLAFMGASIAQKRNRQLSVDTLVRYFPDNLRNPLAFFLDLVQICFFAILLYIGIILTKQQYIWESPTAGISLSLYSLPLVLAMAFMCIYTIITILRRGKFF